MPLKLLFADRKLGAASKLAFMQLWDFAGEQPGRVVITADWLGSSLGRSPKAAWLWLEELVGHDLIKLGERNERRGTVVVDVYNPCPGFAADRVAITDRQKTIDCETASGGTCETASGEDGGSEVLERKPPTPLNKEEEEILTYQTTKEFKESKHSRNSMREWGGLSADVSPIGGLSIDVPPIGGSIAAAIASRTSQAEQKQRLKSRLLSLGVSEWVAGSAANLVVYHEVPEKEFSRILADVDAMRSTGTMRDAAAFVHSQFRALAMRLGKPWPRSKPR